ncbi:MAG: aldo/keto reductase [Promethearchaeota archaeon]
MELKLSSTIELNNGIKMPRLGFGTFEATGKQVQIAVDHALKVGYRHVDTAYVYGNERQVGKAITGSDVPRDDIFITTKLWNTDHGCVEKAFERSLKFLGVDYVDLYLIHWPVRERLETWKLLERFLEEGKARAIGVSNFTIRHLEELFDASETIPAVNQFEFHAFLNQTGLVDFCQERGIAVTAYCPLSKAKKLDHAVLAGIASSHGKTPAQVMLRWILQKNVAAIPKSVRHDRIDENAAIFDFSLDDEEMKRIDGLNEDFRNSWDPHDVDKWP